MGGVAVRVEIFLIKNLIKNIYTFYLFSSKTPHLLHRVTMERQPSQQDSHRFHHERAARCPPLFFSAWVATRFLNPHQVMGEGSAPFWGDVGVVVWGWQGPPGVGRPVHGRAPKRHSWQRRGLQTAASGDVVLVDVGAVACGVHRAARSPPPFQVHAKCGASLVVRSLGWADPLEKEMATHSSTLPWKIP